MVSPTSANAVIAAVVGDVPVLSQKDRRVLGQYDRLGVIVIRVGDVGSQIGGVPVTVAVLVNVPASTSAWVSV